MLLLAATIIPRLHLLDYTRDFWHDEAFQYLISLKPLSFILNSPDVHPPLFNIFTKILLSAHITSPYALRTSIIALSAIFILALYLMLTKIFNRSTGFYGALYAALLPTYIYYGTEFRNYTLALIFVALQIYYFNTEKRTGYILTSLAMIYTHYLTGLIIFAQIIYMTITNTLRKRTTDLAIIAAGALPLSIYLIRTIPKIQSFWFQDIGLKSLISTFYYILSPPTAFPLIPMTIYGVIIATVIIFRKRLNRRHLQLALYIFVPILTMWSISQLVPFYHHRYFLFSAIGIIGLLAWGTHQWGLKLPDSEQAVAGFILVILIIDWPLWVASFPTELTESAYLLQNQSGINIVHRSTFSYLPYKVMLPQDRHYLVTNLTQQQLFTAGGSAVNYTDKYDSLADLNLSHYYIIDIVPHGQIIYNRGGLYVSKT